MALALAQTVKIDATTGASITVNNAITYSAGSLAIANVSFFQGTATSFTASDSGNGAYTILTGRDAGDPGVRQGYKANVSAGLVNLTIANGGNGGVGIFQEVTGADTSAPFTTGEQAGTTGTSTSPDAGAVTNSVADSIYVSVVANASGSNPATMNINQTGTEGTWVRDATNGQQLDGVNYPVTCAVTQIVASSAARSHTWGTESVLWAASTACWKAASGGGGGGTPNNLTVLGVG